MLERDGLVAETSGPARADQADPRVLADAARPTSSSRRRHDKMLSAVLREVREQFGTPAVDRIFDGLSKRAVDRARRRITAETPEKRVAQLTEMLRESGVVADYSLIDGGFALHEHNCPYTSVAQGASRNVPGDPPRDRRDDRRRARRRRSRWRSGGKECRFEMKPATRRDDRVVEREAMDFPKFQRLVEERTGLSHDGEPDRQRRVLQRLVRRHVQLFLKVGPGAVIEDISYFTTGCGFGTATCSLVVDLAKGKTIDDAAAISPADVEAQLGGYPEKKKDYPERALEALHVAIDDYRAQVAAGAIPDSGHAAMPAAAAAAPSRQRLRRVAPPRRAATESSSSSSAKRRQLCSNSIS